MDEAAIEAKGLAPLKPALDRDRRDRRQGRPRARARRDAARRRRRPEQHELLHAERPRPLGRAGPRRRRRGTPPFLLQGGLGIPDRDYYLDAVAAHGGDPDEVRGARREHARRSPAIPDAGGEGGADLRARERRSRRRTRAARTRRTSSRGTTTGRARTSRPRRRASTGPRTSRPRGSAAQPSFVVWQPGAVTGLAALVASEPLDTWKDYLTFQTLSSAPAAVPAEGVRRRALRVLRDDAHGRAEAARPLEARRGRDGRAPSAKPSAGSTSRSTSRRPRRRAPRRW